MGQYYNDMLKDMRTAAVQDAQVRQKESASKMIWVTFLKKVFSNIHAALDDPNPATGDEYDALHF